jgi:hypothetical protein
MAGDNGPRKATAPGVGLAYDVAAQRLAAQFAQVDATNTRLGAVLAATIAITVVAMQPFIPNLVRGITVVWLTGALLQALRASLTGRWVSAPDPQTFAAYAGDDPDYMKELFLPAVLDAIRKNERPLELKSWRLNWALGLAGLALFSLVLGRVIAG